MEPTNSELDKWAAGFMGLAVLDEGYIFCPQTPDRQWHPSTSHDQCQMVLEKLTEDQQEEVGEILQCPLLGNLRVVLMATPRQKLLAVYRAVEGK